MIDNSPLLLVLTDSGQALIDRRGLGSVSYEDGEMYLFLSLISRFGAASAGDACRIIMDCMDDHREWDLTNPGSEGPPGRRVELTVWLRLAASIENGSVEAEALQRGLVRVKADAM